MHVDNKLSCPICNRWEEDADLRIASFEYSYLILNRDQFFPGYCLLFTKEHITELFHLDKVVRQGLFEEVTRAASAIANAFKPDKINYELLGNMAPHIHWHLIPRFSTDPLWPRPVWAEPHADTTLTQEAYTKQCDLIRNALEII